MIIEFVRAPTHDAYLSKRKDVRSTGSESDYLREVAGADVSVIVSGSDVAGTFALVRRVRAALPLHPFVLVVPLSSRSARELAFVAVPPLTWLTWEGEAESTLSGLLDAARSADPRHGLYLRLTQSREITPLIVSALRVILLSPDAVRSVRDLCDRLGVAESTFRYHWRGAFPATSVRTLIDGSALLAHLHAARFVGQGRANRAGGRSSRAIARIALKLFGKSIHQLKSDPQGGAVFARSLAATLSKSA